LPNVKEPKLIGQSPFDRFCDAPGIEHRRTKVNHPSANGQVEHMTPISAGVRVCFAMLFSRSGKLTFYSRQKEKKIPLGKLADSHSEQPPPTEQASAWRAAPYFRHACPVFSAILLSALWWWWKAQPFGHCYGDRHHDHHRHSSKYRRVGLFLLAAGCCSRSPSIICT